MNKMEYKIDKKPEDGQNEFETVIEITGLSSKVTINQLLDHYENTNKVIREQKAQIEVNKTLNEKAIELLPMLKDIPTDKLNLVLSYASKSLANQQSEELIKDCEESNVNYERHLKAIEEQLGIKCLPKISPFNPVNVEFKKGEQKDGEGSN